MTMPGDIIILRHSESEGNIAVESARTGDNSHFTQEFRERPDSDWRLTPKGIEQARAAGAWILKNVGCEFDGYFVSPYERARETAGLLDLPNAEWRESQLLRERDWGDISTMPTSEHKDQYPNNALMQRTNIPYWRPPGGESIADVRRRVQGVFETLHRNYSDKRVILVTHGEVMWTLRAELGYMTNKQWTEAWLDHNQAIQNAQVEQYSRINPYTKEISPFLSWKRSVCPWMSETGSDWQPIEPKKLSNEDLLSNILGEY